MKLNVYLLRILFFLICLNLWGITYAQILVPGDSFGNTQGAFSVSDAGAATYHIPFVLPAGTAGLQPKLGLTYSSQSGNNFVGLGWTLSGLSTITRSSKTRAQDETTNAAQQTKAVSLGISYSKSDRFSLDGERLVLAPESVNSTIAFDDNYGDDQTTYYTEQNSFTKIVLTASTPSTQFFKAYTKSGLIYEYGNTADSRLVDPAKNVAYQWLVNRIEDRKGNYMTFSYTLDATTGEVYPDKIEYTGNSAGGLSPYNKIQFFWETRPDRSSVYGIRYQRKNTFQKRLRSVQVLYQNTLVREYKLSYSYNQYSLLTQVQECDGSSPQVCLEPTTFNWSNLELGLGTPVEVTTMPGASDRRIFGDFNGDGLTDIALWDIPASTADVVIQFYLNDGTGKFTLSAGSGSTTTIGGGEQLRVQTGEVNGDNINDIIVTWRSLPDPGAGNNCLFLVSNPAPPNPGAEYTYPCTYYTKLGRIGDSPFDDYIVDLNQDGITDFVDYQTEAGTNKPVLTGGRIAATLPANSATAQTYYGTVNQAALNGYNIAWTSTSIPDVSFEDINNDGLTDLFVVDRTDGKNLFIFTESARTTTDIASRKNQFRATNKSYVRSLLDQSWLAGSTNKISLNDLNADNLPDALIIKPTTNQVVIIPNKGDNGFEIAGSHLTYTVSILSSYSNVFPNDFNADGLLDLTFYETANGTSRTYINQGEFVFNFSAPLADVWPLFRFKDPGTNPKPQTGIFLKASHSDLLYFNPANSKYYVQRMRQSQGFTIKKITNGAGFSNEIRYDNLLNSDFYEKAGQVTFPNIDIQSALYVVAKTKTITTTGEETAKKYRYCGATINVEGRGFRGFTKIIETDTITGIYDAKYYRQGDDQWKYTGETIIKTERYLANDVLIARTSHNPTLIPYPDNANAKCFYAYPREEITEDFISNKTQKIRQQHDNYGNPAYVVTDFGQGFRDSTANIYTDNPAIWILGRLTQATVSRFASGQPTEVRQASFEYDGTTGLLRNETSDANLAAEKRIVKTYIYDTFGNITQSNTNAWTGSVFQDRTVQTTYDALTKRFVVQAINPSGHTTSATYEQKFGLPLTETDANGLTVTYQYDGFSRLIKQTMPDGTWKAIAYRKASSSLFQSPADAVFLTYTQGSNGQVVVEHYDSYNRGIQTKSKGFDGRWVIADNIYSRVTSPDVREIIRNNYSYYEGENSTGYTQKELDRLGRVVAVKETKTGGVRTATSEYGGLLTTMFNYKSQKKTDVDDVKGRVVESRWNDGNNVYFTYDAAGRLLTTKDIKGNIITNEYDARGDKIRMTDPDMGTYQYEYNGFGELIKQTYPNGNIVTMTYDKLGRMLTRIDVEGTTTNTYDVGNKAIGKLSSVTSYVSTHTFSYDNLGRKSAETVTVNGQTYTTTNTYDGQGRLNTLSYPSSGLVLKHVYNTYGYLAELRNNADNSLFWRVNTMDANGHILLQEYGNGVKTEQQYEAATQYLQSIRSFYNNTTLQYFSFTFNDLAHLVERRDEKRGNAESFNYDDVNRLIETKLNNTTTTTLEYDVLGNITYKSDVGSYEYGGVNNGPHRLLNVRTNNANVQCSFTLNIDTKYTSFNKVKEISNDTARVEVFYGPDQQRIMQKMYVRGSLTRTKLYIGGITEVEIFSSGKTVTTNFIGGIGMQVTEKQGSSSAVTTLKYYLKDHLGSNTGFTGAGGVLLEELSYDAWGKRRNADWTASTTAVAGSHERGFTNHEHYDLFAMIDMNGRVYDPTLGRFLQPDPFIQDMTDLQDLNRYSYVGNNPLSYTDPSGYFFKKIFKAIGRAIGAVANFVKENWKPLLTVAVAIATAWATGGLSLQATFGQLVYSGAAAGFAANVTGALLNGSGLGTALKAGVKGAIIGGVTAGLTYGVGELAQIPLGELPWRASALQQAESIGVKIVGNGFVQGVMSEVTGGKFIHGFTEGAFSEIKGLIQDFAYDKLKKNYHKIIKQFTFQTEVFNDTPILWNAFTIGGAITIPPFIFTPTENYVNESWKGQNLPGLPSKYTDLLRHEFGHMLQYGALSAISGSLRHGYVLYSITVGAPSIISGGLRGDDHQHTYSEGVANQFSYWLAGRPNNWNFKRYPVYTE